MSAAHDIADIKARHSLAAEVGKQVALKRSGREMVGLCPFHQEKTPSFTVVEERGFFHCFGCGAHGDVIDFIAQFHNVDFLGACEILDGRAESTVRPLPRPQKPRPVLTATDMPDGPEMVAGDRIRAWNPKQEHWATYVPDAVFPYRSRDGDLLGYVLRIDIPATLEQGAAKIILTLRGALIEGKPKWALLPFDEPRPLYGLPRLDQQATVFLVEGEGKADALSALMCVPALSWPGGTNGPAHSDFSTLAGRDVIVWADADKVGDVAAVEVALACETAGASTRLIPWDKSRPAGWDATDAINEGWDAEAVWQLVEARSVKILLGSPEEGGDGDFDANAFTGELPPPRPWAYSRLLMFRTVTALAAPAGTGKSTWALQLAIAFSQHMKIGPFEPIRTGPVWVWNNEEDMAEMNRRVLAACAAMSVSPGKLGGRLFLNSGADRALIVAKEDRRTGQVVATPDVPRVIEIIKRREIKLLIVDPFSETFEVESENSNDAMKRVARLYRDIAWQAECAVMLSAHTPKGTNSDRSAGDLDAIRGGGAIGGVVRGAWTMFGMSEEDAEAVGVPPASRHLYVRMDSAKANMALREPEPVWWRKESVPLGNADANYPEDIVGALVHQNFTPVAAKRADDEIAKLDRISDEIVRICELRGWTSADRAAPLDTLAGALDREVTKLSERTSKNLIIGQMGYSHRHEDHLIMVVQEARGPHTIRKIYALRSPA